MTLSEILDELSRAEIAGLAVVADAADLEALREAEIAIMGRSSALSVVSRGLGKLDEGARREAGGRTNEVRSALQGALRRRQAELEAARDAALLESERVDVSLPGRRARAGAVHPITRVSDEIVDVFTGLGYRVAEGPEVETDWHNFEALNMPPDHPARSMFDTLYVEGDRLVLRTHTSPVQIRTMLSQRPPLYVVAPGRVYRADTFDPTHSPVFNQVEGLAVDRGISLAHLKGTLEAFAVAMFGEGRRIRLRPSYFPFVEPGAEVDVSCFICDGTGCRLCRGEGWIEILGAGMVHPAVLTAVGYDPEEFSGFAFGIGIERIAMLRDGVADIRSFTENDLRFLAGMAGGR